MSRVSLPAAVQPGQVVCDIELLQEDAQQMLDKLKMALDVLLRSKGQAPAGSPVVPALVPGLALLPPHLQQQATVPPFQAQQPTAAPSPLSQQRARAPPPLLRMPATAPRPAAAAAPQPRLPASARAPAASAAAAGGGLSWQLCWTSDAAEHSSEAVSSMAYVPHIEGLPGGDGHAGWLISSSRGLLNLWEASPSGGHGEPALMCMHSQGTDYMSVCLDAERGTRMLLSASMDHSGNEWVTAHSLEAITLLAPKGRCPMPHNAVSKIAGQNCLAVASLHGFGASLAQTCVSAYGGALVVWPIGTASKPGTSKSTTPDSLAPKATWKAHDSLITYLHKSSFGLSLYSGAADGKVHMFNMREKPNRPNAVFSQQGRITGIYQLNDSQLLTTAGDGRMMVWDMRNASAGPLKFAVPDTKPIVRMAVSPFADSVAVATTAGIYLVDLMDSACTITLLVPSLRTPATALVFNTAASEVGLECKVIVAGGPGGAGTISVFKQRLAGY